MRIGLAVLTLDEEEGLKSILPGLPIGEVEDVFAVDGGSRDQSVSLLQSAGIRVLSQSSPGRGEAFRLAMDHAKSSLDALIFFSPDGNEDPNDIPRFRPYLEEGYDMVIASRMMAGAVNEEDHKFLRPRKWANLAFDALAHLTFGSRQPRITDAINGYRAITIPAWNRLDLDGTGFTIEYQSSIRAYKLGLRVKEFPTVEGARIGGESTAHSIPTGMRFLRLYWSELVRRSDH